MQAFREIRAMFDKINPLEWSTIKGTVESEFDL